MLHRNIDIENIAFVDLTSHHRLVDRDCNLFSGTGFSHIFSLVLDPDDLSDPLSSAVDERILRLDDAIEHFDADNGGIATPEHEPLQQLDPSRPNEKIHLGLRTCPSLSLHPPRILLQNMIQNIALADRKLR